MILCSFYSTIIFNENVFEAFFFLQRNVKYKRLNFPINCAYILIAQYFDLKVSSDVSVDDCELFTQEELIG